MKQKQIFDVAVIDDGINSFLLNKNCKVKTYRIYKTNAIRCFGETHITHGTICGAIISENVCIKKLISIKVKDFCQEGKLDDFLNALKYCEKRHIKLINISIGSTESTDKKYMDKIIQKLISNGAIIVAAMSNSGELTYPANLPGVIAVQTSLNEGCSIVFESNSYTMKLQLPTNIDILGKEILVDNCNSFCTAMITKIISNIICTNPNYNSKDVMQILTDGIK